MKAGNGREVNQYRGFNSDPNQENNRQTHNQHTHWEANINKDISLRDNQRGNCTNQDAFSEDYDYILEWKSLMNTRRSHTKMEGKKMNMAVPCSIIGIKRWESV